jgi:hypothetical protein
LSAGDPPYKGLMNLAKGREVRRREMYPCIFRWQ